MTSLKLTQLTATRGLHYNVKIDAYRSRAPTLPALCIAAGERSEGFRRNETKFRTSGADRDAPGDDCRQRKRHNGSRSQPVEWSRLRTWKTNHTAICRRGQ